MPRAQQAVVHREPLALEALQVRSNQRRGHCEIPREKGIFHRGGDTPARPSWVGYFECASLPGPQDLPVVLGLKELSLV